MSSPNLSAMPDPTKITSPTNEEKKEIEFPDSNQKDSA